MLIDIFSLKFPKEVRGILHLGAHECEERFKYLSRFNSITDDDIIWIDALKDKVNSIKQNNNTIQIFNECISNTDNEVISFTITNNYQSSSILNLKEHLLEHPDIHEISRIEMKTKTLKTFYKENNFKQEQFNFFAIDIQGAELLALIGAGDILNTVDYIYIEVNTKELYENCALLDDIDSYLYKFNFVRKNILMTEHGWGDAFYVKEYFNISSNIKIQYGTDLIKIDITEHVLTKNINNNIIYIPTGDDNRALLYGDPIYGELKNIYIETTTDTYIIDHTDEIYINKNINTLSLNFLKNNTSNYKLSVMAIFKNESLNLKTWIEHYIWQGVEHFYLIDNDSDDKPLDILQHYIDIGFVSYFYRPEKWKQTEHYRNIFDENNLKETTKWLIICDLDEFFFGTEKKLITTLEDFDKYDVINTHSFFYGPDDNIEHPKDIRISNIYRNSDTINGNKYIFKPKIIKDSSEIWIHWLVIPNTYTQNHYDNEIYEDIKIRLNHYQIQSLYFFEKIKMTRGDVSKLENEYIRTKELFEHHKNTCTIKDDILKNIIENNTYYKNNKGMEFYDENGITIDHESLEYPEQQLVNEYILEDDIVLELGARYGTVSCNINKKLKNKKNQISVEPDERVWNALELNKIRNNCDFNIVNGFISNKKLDLTNLGEGLSGYGSTFIENYDTNIPCYSLDEIKKKNNINHFTVLVADCEGFLETFFDENPNFYHDLRLIIFEADYPEKCNYDIIKQNLTSYGFINKLNGHQNVWIKNI
jgi:FkbM family methyltransferase